MGHVLRLAPQKDWDAKQPGTIGAAFWTALEGVQAKFNDSGIETSFYGRLDRDWRAPLLLSKLRNQQDTIMTVSVRCDNRACRR